MRRTIDRKSLWDEPRHDELGQTMAEYGILVSLISVALIVVLGVGGFGTALAAVWNNIIASL